MDTGLSFCVHQARHAAGIVAKTVSNWPWLHSDLESVTANAGRRRDVVLSRHNTSIMLNARTAMSQQGLESWQQLEEPDRCP